LYEFTFFTKLTQSPLIFPELAMQALTEDAFCVILLFDVLEVRKRLFYETNKPGVTFMSATPGLLPGSETYPEPYWTCISKGQ
jgi:hypothetical protein